MKRRADLRGNIPFNSYYIVRMHGLYCAYNCRGLVRQVTRFVLSVSVRRVMIVPSIYAAAVHIEGARG